jgi:cation diffusion facilitator family transporter
LISHHATAASRHGRPLLGAVALSATILGIELVSGVLTNSLALLADAAHVFADTSGMALALGAIRLANRPATTGRSFGLFRIEIVAAIANALLLLGLAALLAYNAIARLVSPPDVLGPAVALVALVALGLDLVALRLLGHGAEESVTIRGAYLEVLGDLFGVTAVLVAGLVIALTGWTQADALATLAVAALIVPRSVGLLRASLDILLEATPEGVELAEVRSHILEVDGVLDVHDLHAWTITSGMNVLSAHVVIEDDAPPGRVLDDLALCLARDFDIDHSTFQLETSEHVNWEARNEASRARPAR